MKRAKIHPYQSQLLQRYPVVPERSKKLIAKRTFLTTLTLFALWCFLISIHEQWWPRPLGDPLYGIHDHLYLRLKGWLYFFPYPYSLSYFWLFLMVAVPGTVFFVFDRSMVRWLHILLLNRLFVQRMTAGYTHNPEMDPAHNRPFALFLKLSTPLKRLGLPPAMLEAVLERKRRDALDQLLHHALTGPSSADPTQVLAHTALAIRLKLLNPIDPSDLDDALHLWQTAYLAATLHFSGLDDKTVKRHQRCLEVILECLIQHHGPLPNLLEPQPQIGFQTTVLLRDMRALLTLAFTTPSPAQVVQLQSAVSHSHHARAQTIKNLLLEAESFMQTGAKKKEVTKPKLNDLLSQDNADTENSRNLKPAELRFSAGIALELARWTQQPRVAVSFLESMEALHLLVYANLLICPAKVNPKDLLPTDDFFRLAAELQGPHLNQAQIAWSGREDPDFPVLEHHFAQKKNLMAQLYHAALPTTQTKSSQAKDRQ